MGGGVKLSVIMTLTVGNMICESPLMGTIFLLVRVVKGQMASVTYVRTIIGERSLSLEK